MTLSWQPLKNTTRNNLL